MMRNPREKANDQANGNHLADEGAVVGIADRPRRASADQVEQAERLDSDERAVVNILGRKIPRADVFRAVGLLLLVLVMVIVTVSLWPVISSVFNDQGRENLIKNIRNVGPLGVLMLLGLEFVQIVVAFIPGEVVQVVAGALYGPWIGALIILVGCVLSTWFVYEVVHRLGQPFVEEMVSTKHLSRFREFEKSGKLSVMVFVLFLIPGLPKDVFTYLVPLTSMPRREFLTLATIARSPGVFMSTFAASGLVKGNIVQSVVVFAIVGVVALVGILNRERILDWLGRKDRE